MERSRGEQACRVFWRFFWPLHGHPLLPCIVLHPFCISHSVLADQEGSGNQGFVHVRRRGMRKDVHHGRVLRLLLLAKEAPLPLPLLHARGPSRPLSSSSLTSSTPSNLALLCTKHRVQTLTSRLLVRTPVRLLVPVQVHQRLHGIRQSGLGRADVESVAKQIINQDGKLCAHPPTLPLSL